MKDLSAEIKRWNGLRAGNEADFRFLYLQYYDELIHYGLHLKQDIHASSEYINRMFANLWSKKETLPEVNNPKAYIITCYRNLIIRQRKTKLVLLTAYPGDEYLHHQDYPDLDFEDHTFRAGELLRQKTRIASALDTLTIRQKELIESRFIYEKSYEEIAAHFQISVRTVYNSIHESLKLLRTRLSREDFL